MKQKVLPQLAAAPVLTDAGKLRGSECMECRTPVFPAAAICPNCLSTQMAERSFDGKGTLYTYTVLHSAARGWQAPYILAYIDLPEGVRVFAHLTEVDPAQLRLDMPVSLRLTTPVINFEGQEVLSFKFGPA